MREKKAKEYTILLGIIILCSLIILYFLADWKKGMHEDEFYTYSLSNSESGLQVSFENGKKLNPIDCYNECFYADELNIKNVWHNQKNDVHPPLYYLLFHIFSLVMHHYGGVKSGIIFNAFLHIVNILIIYLILRKILCREDMSLLGCGLYAMMPAVLGNVIFIRMYTMLSTFVLALILSMIYGMLEGMDRKFYIQLGIVCVGGILTHYYFIVYLFYSCLVYGFWLALSKRWRQLAGFAATICLSAGMSCVIFPHMLSHIFLEYRGKQSVDNLMHSLWGESLKFYFPKLDAVFGGLLLVMMIAAGIFFLKNGGSFLHKRIERLNILLILLIPYVLYFLTITKIAVLKSERYISPIYSVSIILLIFGVQKITSVICASEGAAVAIAICVVSIILGNSWKTYAWDELHLDTEQYMNIARQYGIDNECINIYDKVWESISALQEFTQYQALSFISSNDMELLDLEYIKAYEHVVVYIESDIGEERINSILGMLMDKNPKLEQYNMLYQYGYQTAYYLD